MDQALYHRDHGYYSSGRAAIGRRGDYFTNVSVGPLFGQLLAAQFAEMWERLGKIEHFVIVEQGAHHGDLAHDVLGATRTRFPEVFSALHYRIVEPFPLLQDRQSQTLSEFGDRVQWRRSLDELEPFVGLHFSNELIDAFPAHLLISSEKGWREKFVALNGDEFVFVDQPIVEPILQAIAQKLPSRPAGYETEVNLAALDLIDHLSRKLERGYVLLIDYGFPRDEFFAEYRTAGTLQIRAQHGRLASPFEEIGRADVAAHVDWTNLAEHAQESGLSIVGFTDQHHFITGIISEFNKGVSPEPPANASPVRTDWDQSPLPFDPKSKRALQTLLHPEMLGRVFQVLALAKDVDPASRLAGFKFAGRAGAVLGL
jgi:SAM-dependent MidA family methyltransferase